jgi:hypothetical protein
MRPSGLCLEGGYVEELYVLLIFSLLPNVNICSGYRYIPQPEKSRLSERLATVHLLVLTCLSQLIYTMQMLFSILKTSYLYEEVNCTLVFPFSKGSLP